MSKKSKNKRVVFYCNNIIYLIQLTWYVRNHDTWDEEMFND